MKIVFLGWGSLIWSPEKLQTHGDWQDDGPELPIEFARISRDGRLTLVLYSTADHSPVCWIHAKAANLTEALNNLKEREGTSLKRIEYASLADSTSNCAVIPTIIDTIRPWAIRKKIDAVVWTGLTSNFTEKTDVDVNQENITTYLTQLSTVKQEKAREYIEKAPLQIKTKFRKHIEANLGWRH